MSWMNSSLPTASPAAARPCRARRERHQGTHSAWPPSAVRQSEASRSAGPLPGTAQATARARLCTGSRLSRSAQRTWSPEAPNCAKSCSRTSSAMPGSVRAEVKRSKNTSSLPALGSARLTSVLLRSEGDSWSSGLGCDGGTTTGTDCRELRCVALLLGLLLRHGARRSMGLVEVLSASTAAVMRVVDTNDAGAGAAFAGFCALPA
mmetsp:Transcript_3389/g.10896  ORF Transcript_3389/g.10896 Transcript_3389/m.10896 type:complete len:206 (-) Transcript_3389:513-1130(-)